VTRSRLTATRSPGPRADNSAGEGRADGQVGGNFGGERVKDVAHDEGDGADTKKHKLDLFLPKGQQGFLVPFLIHGGARTIRV
jgi:hypothetical protein